MIDHVWSILCTKAVIDKDTNLLTLVDTIEEFTIEAAGVLKTTPEGVEVIPSAEVPAEQLPTIPVTFEIVSLWVRRNPDEPERATAKIKPLPSWARLHFPGRLGDHSIPSCPRSTGY